MGRRTAHGSTGSTNPLVDNHVHHDKIHIIIFGEGKAFTAAVMAGLTPAIEGEEASTPEAAMRKLMLTTCEMLKGYVPKVGAHQRVVHGGGVFDEDLITAEIKKAGPV